MNCYMVKLPLTLTSGLLVLFASFPHPNTIEISLPPEVILVFFLVILMVKRLIRSTILSPRKLSPVEMFTSMKHTFPFITFLTPPFLLLYPHQFFYSLILQIFLQYISFSFFYLFYNHIFFPFFHTCVFFFPLFTFPS